MLRNLIGGFFKVDQTFSSLILPKMSFMYWDPSSRSPTISSMLKGDLSLLITRSGMYIYNFEVKCWSIVYSRILERYPE